MLHYLSRDAFYGCYVIVDVHGIFHQKKKKDEKWIFPLTLFESLCFFRLCLVILIMRKWTSRDVHENLFTDKAGKVKSIAFVVKGIENHFVSAIISSDQIINFFLLSQWKVLQLSSEKNRKSYQASRNEFWLIKKR
jgi:hypothetical protein